MLKLTLRYADNFKKRMDLPPNLYPHTGVASSNASTASSTMVSTLGDSPTDYFGLGKPAVAGEGRFQSLTELKWGEFEAMGFGGLDPAEKKLQLDLTEGAWTVRLDLGSWLRSVTNVHLLYCSREQRNKQRSWPISHPLDSLAPMCYSARHYNSAPPS